jgi:hypothetical protein
MNIESENDLTKTTFVSCEAAQLGGAIYLELADGTEPYFDFSGAEYSIVEGEVNTATSGYG